MNILAYGELTVADISDGVSVLSTDVWYCQSSSASEAPTTNWSTDAPTWENGKYIWSKTVTTLDNGETKESEPVCITGEKGAIGDKGDTGTGITSITEQYYLSTSKTSQAGGSWVDTPPTWEMGKYIWTRSKIVYSNPTSTEYTTPYCDASWEAANDVKTDLENQIEEVKTSVTGVSSKVDAVEKNITNKVWQTDITSAINTYDGSTAKELRDRVTITEQDISGLKTTVSDVQSTLENKADDSTVTALSQKVTSLEQDAESFKTTVSETYVTNDMLKNYSTTEQMNSAITQKADSITSEVESKYATKDGVEEIKSTLTQKDSEIEAKVTNNAGDISTLTTTTNDITAEISNARGDSSSLAIRLDGIDSKISNASGQYSSLSQSIDSFKLEVGNTYASKEDAVTETKRYYLLAEISEAMPTIPDTYPPSDLWQETEPSYTEESTQSLYYVDCDVYCDGSFVYSKVSLSNGYDAQRNVEGATASLSVSIDEINSTVDGLDDSISNVSQTVEHITQEIRDATGSESTLSQTLNSLESRIQDANGKYLSLEQTSSGLSIQIGKLVEQLSIINKHFSFDDNGITISSGDSPLKLRLDNENGIQFLNNNTEVAVMTEQELRITRADIFTSIQIGNFAYIPKSNGSLSFKKIK